MSNILENVILHLCRIDFTDFWLQQLRILYRHHRIRFAHSLRCNVSIDNENTSPNYSIHMEAAREYARQDLAQRIQAYSTAAQQESRRKQRERFNEFYERIEMRGQDLTQPEKNARRADYVESVRQQVQDVLNSDVANLVKDYM